MLAISDIIPSICLIDSSWPRCVVRLARTSSLRYARAISKHVEVALPRGDPCRLPDPSPLRVLHSLRRTLGDRAPLDGTGFSSHVTADNLLWGILHRRPTRLGTDPCSPTCFDKPPRAA